MATKRRVYWIAPQISADHKSRAQILSLGRYSVRFFQSVDDLRACIRDERASIILISEQGTESQALDCIKQLIAIPDTKGVRLILSLENFYESVMKLAAAANFRDMIPLNVEERQWQKRIEYSVAGTPIHLQRPNGQITMSNISAIYIPARIVWISGQKMRIESGMSPRVGSILHLMGAVAERIGVKHISFTVDRIERSHLRYRFSDALVGTWSVPKTHHEKADEFVGSLLGAQESRTCRVLLAAKSTGLRKKIFQSLEAPRFEVNALLKVQAMANEPKYFSPDVVVVEDQLCLGKMKTHFKSMVDQLPASIPVLIVGSDPAIESLPKQFQGHRLYLVPKLPSDFLDSGFGDLFIAQGDNTDESHAVSIDPSDDYSYAELMAPARLAKLHPTMLQIDLPHRIRQFSLCRLSSPVVGRLLGRDLWLKCSELYANEESQDDKFRSSFDAIAVDLTMASRKQMARSILKLISDHMGKLAKREDEVEAYTEPEDRTPELGSLRATQQLITTSQEVPELEVMPKFAPVAVSAEAASARSRSAVKPDIELSFLDWFFTEKGKKTMWQIFWLGIGFGIMLSIFYSVSQRDEETVQKSGKWFQDQITKFAPDKFEK